ncbi:MAG TPA: hypothetical protein VN541_08825, partial [Tepidisphaeraceae bacterium]|nr:hypothetical protein [Tepidisphaeraceae bacterium]
GFVNGIGTATVGGGTVSISATVKSSNGQTSPLAVNCTMDGDHFTGKGMFLNMAVVIEGRVEGADPGNKGGAGNTQSGVVTDAHIGATFRLADGHSGRIVGVMDHAAQVGS